MGTLVGHLVPGLALAFLGLMHTINTIRAYYQNGPAKFRSRFWYPIKKNHLLYLELILVLSFSVFAMVTQLISFPPLQFSLELLNLEHATMFLHLAIFAGFTLFAELNHSTEILTGISGILASSVFSQELFLLHYHSTDHVGLEGHYHWLLQIIVCISLMAALFVTTFPAVFPAALVLSVSVVFQGCWFVNMGFMLWVPRWILALILALVGTVCLVFARNRAGRGGFPNYEQLHSRVVDDPDAISGLKQVQHHLSHSASSRVASRRRRTKPTATPTRTSPGMIAAILKISATALQVEERAPPPLPLPRDGSLSELTILANEWSVQTGRPRVDTLLCALSPPNEFNPLM
nr:transmembrane protein 45B-like [Ipomoea batatas]